MRQTKTFVTIHDTAPLATFGPIGKSLADSFAALHEGYRCEVYSFLRSENKVYISNSQNSRGYSELMINYPLGHKHRSILREYEIVFDADSDLNTITEAIDVATAIVDKLTLEGDHIYVGRLFDHRNYTGTRTILPTMFIGSNYVAQIPSVTVGDAVAGGLLLPPSLEVETPNDGLVI